MKVSTELKTDLLCFSHLRWDFVYQRPQHLMSRFAKQQRVFFIEEPIFGADFPRLDVIPQKDNLLRVVPHLPSGLTEGMVELTLARLVTDLLYMYRVKEYVSWYYTPMAVGFTDHLSPRVTVYDCMDELSAFRGAPPPLLANEAALFKKADLVFTGGTSLYQAKVARHSNVHAFPSSVDRAHFGQARTCAESEDQAQLGHPRLGFFGVIDERMDLPLLDGLARARPDWHIVMVGPIVKIDLADLPLHPNIHYLGNRPYQELPRYLAGWDVALMPFAQNESTRFISPTKTPEYLAGGKPVVSTSIRDVVKPYGELDPVRIADTVPDFVCAVERALESDAYDAIRWARIDQYLSNMSWDVTWSRMAQLIEYELRKNQKPILVPDLQALLRGYSTPAD